MSDRDVSRSRRTDEKGDSKSYRRRERRKILGLIAAFASLAVMIYALVSCIRSWKVASWLSSRATEQQSESILVIDRVGHIEGANRVGAGDNLCSRFGTSKELADVER